MSRFSEGKEHLLFNYEDYCLLPEDKRVELIGGDFYLIPSPSVIHQRVAARIADRLRSFVAERKLGEVLYAPLDVVLTSWKFFPLLPACGTGPSRKSSTPGAGCGSSGW